MDGFFKLLDKILIDPGVFFLPGSKRGVWLTLSLALQLLSYFDTNMLGNQDLSTAVEAFAIFEINFKVTHMRAKNNSLNQRITVRLHLGEKLHHTARVGEED